MPLITFLACLLRFFSFNLICCHRLTSGEPSSYCSYILGSICSRHLWDYSTIQGCWLEGTLPRKESVLLMGEDAPQVPMDPLEFILTPLSMTDAKYQLWRSGILYTQQVSEEMDYDEFNNTCLTPSLTPTIYSLSLSLSLSFSLFSFISLFLCIASHNDVHIGYLCQVGPTTSAPIDPRRLPWSIYVYGPDGFTHKRAKGHKTNVMGNPFLEGTRVVSSSSFLSLSFPTFVSLNTCSNTSFFQNSAHCSGA